MFKQKGFLKRLFGTIVSVTISSVLLTTSVSAGEAIVAEPVEIPVEEVQEVTAAEPESEAVEVMPEIVEAEAEIVEVESEIVALEEETVVGAETEVESFETADASNVIVVQALPGNTADADTKAIQDALDQARTGASIEVRLRGTFQIDKALNIYSNTTLILEGDTRIVRMDDSKMMLIGGGAIGSAAGPAGGYNSRKNIRVEGGTWDGNVTSRNNNGTGKEYSNLMTFYHAENIVIANTALQGCCGTHFIEFAGVKNGKIENTSFSGFVRHERQGDKGKGMPHMLSEMIQLDFTSEESSPIASPYDNTFCTGIEIHHCTFNGGLSAIGNHHMMETAGSNNISIHDNVFNNLEEYCVSIEGFQQVTIQNNKAEKVHTFTRVYGCEGILIENNTATYDTTRKTWVNGVTRHMNLLDESTATFSNNTFTGAELMSIRARGCTVTVNNNRFEDNAGKAEARNIINAEATTLNASGNTMLNATGTAVLVTEGSKATLTNNSIQNATVAAIRVEDGSKATLTNNTIESPQKLGIKIDHSETDIVGGSIHAAGANAIDYVNASKGKVSKIVISDSAKAGLYVNDSSVEISSVTISGSGTNGIHADNKATLNASGNIIRSVKNIGLNITNSSKATLKNNTIEAPATIGIRVDASNVKADGNKITKAGTIGVQYTAGSKGKITNNTITGSGKHGIYVSNSDGVTIDGNMISKSGNNSVLVRDASGKNVLSLKLQAKWKKSGKRWWYENGDGSYPAAAWRQIDGDWYYFNDSGYMTTGWQKIGKKWYYMNKSGVMKTGWVKSGKKWYYMNKSGAMKTGWVKASGEWYYMDKSGAMVSNTSRKIGKKTYTFDKNGVCKNP